MCTSVQRISVGVAGTLVCDLGHTNRALFEAPSASCTTVRHRAAGQRPPAGSVQASKREAFDPP